MAAILNAMMLPFEKNQNLSDQCSMQNFNPLYYATWEQKSKIFFQDDCRKVGL